MATVVRALAAGLTAVVLLTACSSARSTTATAPPTTGAAGPVLRGEVTGPFVCPPAGADPGSGATLPAASVTELLICSPAVPNGPRAAVTVGPSSPQFGPLLSALSGRDEPRAAGQICPLYADVVQPVLARTASTVLVVHIPVDSCGHYQAAARTALHSVTSP